MRPGGRIVAIAAGLSLLAGCANLAGQDPQTLPGPTPLPGEGAQIAGHLEAIGRLTAESGAEQAAMVESARIDAVAVPTAGNRLRYALLLGVPGHAGFDPAGAREALGPLLAQSGGLTGEELALADVLDSHLQTLLSLQQRLDEGDAAAARIEGQLSAISQRAQSLAAENQRLQKELDLARHKLDAIAELEKALSTRRVAPEDGS